MRFMITFRHLLDSGWDQLDETERQRVMQQHEAFQTALREEQDTDLVFLAPPDQAKTIRGRRGGQVEVIDGPYSNAAEFVGGYFIVEVDSMEEAVEWGKRGRYMIGHNEIRQIVEL
jgi:hypothetical protein